MRIRPLTQMTYGNKNLSMSVDPSQEWEVIKETAKSVIIKRDFVEFRIDRHNFTNLWEEIK